MAQSQSDLKTQENSRSRKKSTANQMELSKQELLEMDPEEVLEWEVDRLEAGLKELGITIGVSWTKSKKVHELIKALEKIDKDATETQMPTDPNFYMIQAIQAMEARMQAQAEAMAAIAEKVSGNSDTTSNNGNKSRAKGRHPEKLERDVDYATLLQWEKSWKLYTISDNLETLSDKQQTAIFVQLLHKRIAE